MVKITKFAIFGERCSGTNFLEKSMKSNFNVSLINDFGSKHFFCFNDYSNKNYDDTLFIGIIRNPIYWLNSFSKELYHVPEINKKNLINFLFNEFYSICDQIDVPIGIIDGNIVFNNKSMYIQKNDINKLDLNYLTNNKYKNIFELRKIKNDYLMNVMPKLVKNYILINYEDLLYNYDNVLDNIYIKFSLIKLNNKYIKINKYKKSDKYNFIKQRNITFTPHLINIIWNNLNIEQENKLGYFKYDDNNYFKNKIEHKK
jgi:hypothetical protein